MRKTITIIIVSICCSAIAKTIENNGIYYNIDETNKTAKVTYRPYYKTPGDESSAETDGWIRYQADQLYVGNLTVPSSFTHEEQNFTVIGFDNDALAGSKYLETLSIPSTVTSFGSGTFSLCNALSYIKVDNGNPNYTSIDGILYKRNGKNLEIFYVPKAIKGYDGEIKIPEEVITIPSSAFQNCDYVNTITLSANVTSIKDGAFSECDNLYTINFNNKLTSIGLKAFYNCKKLDYISFPTSLKTIGTHAFSNCTNLTMVYLNEGLEEIQDYAFYYCSSIIGLTVPSTLTTIGDKAFLDCTSLKTIKNLSQLPLTAGSDSYGCIAKYATQITTSIDEAQTDNCIIVSGHCIKSKETAIVRNLSGITLGSGKEIEINAPGIYIVTAGNKTQKVVIR